MKTIQLNITDKAFKRLYSEIMVQGFAFQGETRDLTSAFAVLICEAIAANKDVKTVSTTNDPEGDQ